MAKKKPQKELKRLKKKVKKSSAANLALEKRILKLQKRLDARKQQIVNLESKLSAQGSLPQSENTAPAGIGDQEGGIASSQRAAWKQHKYLRDRYEVHLDAGATKTDARQLANDDLRMEFGMDSGFSQEELGAILS